MIARINPRESYKLQNLFLAVIIAASKNPKEAVSFLVPRLRELDTLSISGVEVTMYDGHRRLGRLHDFTVFVT